MLGRRCAPLALACAVLVLAVAAVLVSSHGADAQLVTEIRIDIKEGQEQQTASITDLTGTNLTFDFTLTFVRSIPLNPVTVTPIARFETAANDWDVKFDPVSWRFNGTGSHDFVAGVLVPENLSAGLVFRLTFDATAEGLALYNTQPDTAYIEILQYYKIGRSYSTETMHLRQGDSQTYNFTILNRGNGVDVIHVTLEGEGALTAQGVTILYDSSKRLVPWETGVLAFIISIDPDALPTTITFSFTLRSQGSDETVSSSVPYSLVIDEAVLIGLLNDYWWVLVILVLVVVVLSVMGVRRRRRSREDKEAMALLKEAHGAIDAKSPKDSGGDGDDAPADEETDGGGDDPSSEVGDGATKVGTSEELDGDEVIEVDVSSE